MLLALCGLPPGDPTQPMILAIDAPLGFSAALVELLTQGKTVPEIGQSATNPYLFRRTERMLFEAGLSPLSAIKDMIGSQTTKAIHTLARLAPIIAATGVWTDGNGLQALETYPAACESRFTAAERAAIAQIPDKPDDIGDAYRCALIAHRFATAPETLAPPPDKIPKSEGWIWLPPEHAGDGH
jgi:predicted nuclease with RNAse H fold